MKVQPRVLLIDDQWGQPDDPQIPSLYGALPFHFLLESSENSQGLFTVEKSLARIKKEMPNLSVILLDIMFGPKGNRLGLEILEKVRLQYPILPILMLTSLTSSDDRETVIRCMELGANEYIVKAPNATQMHRILTIYSDPDSDLALYGSSGSMRKLRSDIARTALNSDISVLIYGESGTGKELVARSIYRQGPNNSGAFVAKNCAYSDSQLLESELFGHEKGAFTGATEKKIGLIEEADNGVLFLDEISDMPVSLQAKLLRVIETRTFRRLGGQQDLKSNFQLISATNRNLSGLVNENKFRGDLYHRIKGMEITTAPLRDRTDDIPVYIELFTKKFKSRGGQSYPGLNLSSEATNCFLKYKWPGNVRELRNVVERAIILSREKTIGTDCLPPEISIETEQLQSEITLKAPGFFGNKKSMGIERLPQKRLINELKIALETKQHIQTYKGSMWKAEFMRLLYPSCKAQNAKGFSDLIKRLTKGPWGDPEWEKDDELKELINELKA